MPFIGPLLHHLAAASAWSAHARLAQLRAIIGRVTLILVALAFLAFVIPANYQNLGPWSLALTMGALISARAVALVTGRRGAASPVAERGGGEDMLLTVAMAGFLVHALADGAALFSFGGPSTLVVGPAIVIDRCSMGTLVWAMVAPRLGRGLGFLAVGALSLTTWAGYELMEFVAGVVANPTLLGVIQSLLAGTVLELALFHQPLTLRPTELGRPI